MTTTDAPRHIIRRTTLGDIPTRSARRRPQSIALWDGDESLTYAALEAQANQLAHHLLASGLQPGAKVAMLASNSIEMVVATFGIFKAGMVWVPVNHMLGGADVRYVIEHAEAAMVLADHELLQRPDLAPTVQELGLPVLVLSPGRTSGATTPLLQALQGQPATPPGIAIDDDDLVLLMYTSGTTGKQKGVMHSHASVHSALLSNAAEGKMDIHMVATLGLPLFHCAQFSGLGAGLIAGSSMVLFRAFDPHVYLDAVERRRITQLTGLPLMYAALLQVQTQQPRDLSSLQMCTYGMAPMPRPLLEKLTAHFCPSFALGSGQTEAFPITVRFRPEQQLQRFGSYWGTSTMANDTAIMDGDGNLLPWGEVGEIVHRGANVMLGYYKDPEATAAVSRFGWHHTGDIGKFDEDGQLLFLDRTKDMIKTGGENVPSIKVEEVYLRHPAVANAAVVGLPHARWGEAVTVFVLLKPGAQATVDELIGHGRQQLAGFEAPKHVQILQEFPMTPTGKIQKHRLRTQFLELFSNQATTA
ncbi:acyl-CoA synthetase [Comamonas faecalis]|uniref:Acyl-CoA synthetase n=1 Tax=Comamonas faecalis TaxID=1387849 RepID=A0ABP7RVU3_9BURK